MTGVVTEGMSKRQVKRLLGPPHASKSTRQFLRESRRSGVDVVSLGRLGNSHYWLYLNVPAGYDTQIVFDRGKVTKVSVVPTRRV